LVDWSWADFFISSSPVSNSLPLSLSYLSMPLIFCSCSAFVVFSFVICSCSWFIFSRFFLSFYWSAGFWFCDAVSVLSCRCANYFRVSSSSACSAAIFAF
jgi:hypothetical protein